MHADTTSVVQCVANPSSASRVQATQANDDWLREVVTGEDLPQRHPVDGSPLFRRVIPSACRVAERWSEPVGYRAMTSRDSCR